MTDKPQDVPPIGDVPATDEEIEDMRAIMSRRHPHQLYHITNFELSRILNRLSASEARVKEVEAERDALLVEKSDLLEERNDFAALSEKYKTELASLRATPTQGDADCAVQCANVSLEVHMDMQGGTDDDVEEDEYPIVVNRMSKIIAAHVAQTRAELGEAVGLLGEVAHYGGGAVDACSDHYVVDRIRAFLSRHDAAGEREGYV